MSVTKQCILVLRETEFPIRIYRELEMLLTEHMAKDVINHIWMIDPKGIYSAVWHIEQINQHLTKTKEYAVKVHFNKKFWEVYDLISIHLRPFGIQSLPLINKMKDLKKIKMALLYARSLYQLYEDYIKIPEFSVPEKIEKYKVKKIELN